MKAIYIENKVDEFDKVVTQNVKFVDAPKDSKDNLEFFYKHIDTNMIDVVFAEGFDIWVDDEGLLKSGNAVIEFELDGRKVPLAGNFIITKNPDAEGNTQFFDEDADAEVITKVVGVLERCTLKGVTR